jgi:hypothetical protein
MSGKIMQDAVGIEHSFKMLMGLGIGEIDADIFREGDSKELGLLLQKTADVLVKRMGYLKFEPWELDSGKTKIRLASAISKLREIGKEMENTEIYEPDDYHWNIVGMLIQIISSLFDHIEGDTRL